MDMTSLTDLYSESVELTVLPLFLPMFMGAGAVDPELIEPRDEQESQDVEELIAFRCSCL